MAHCQDREIKSRLENNILILGNEKKIPRGTELCFMINLQHTNNEWIVHISDNRDIPV